MVDTVTIYIIPTLRGVVLSSESQDSIRGRGCACVNWGTGGDANDFLGNLFFADDWRDFFCWGWLQREIT